MEGQFTPPKRRRLRPSPPPNDLQISDLQTAITLVAMGTSLLGARGKYRRGCDEDGTTFCCVFFLHLFFVFFCFFLGLWRSWRPLPFHGLVRSWRVEDAPFSTSSMHPRGWQYGGTAARASQTWTEIRQVFRFVGCAPSVSTSVCISIGRPPCPWLGRLVYWPRSPYFNAQLMVIPYTCTILYLLVAPGIRASLQEATSNKGHRYSLLLGTRSY